MPPKARPKNVVSWATLLSLWYVTFITKISPKPRFLSASCVEQKSSESPFYLKGRFSKKLLTFIKPTENKTFSVYDPLGIKLLHRLRVDFGHVNEHKFRDNFADTLNPLCSSSLETESTAHFFLCCRNYTNICITLMNELNDIDNLMKWITLNNSLWWLHVSK